MSPASASGGITTAASRVPARRPLIWLAVVASCSSSRTFGRANRNARGVPRREDADVGVEGEPEDLKPEAVAPGVAFLASAACTEGGWILRAANGQFHATRAAEAEGVDYPRDLRAVRADTPAAVSAAWNRIAVMAREPRG